jgi:hypothetical protein
METSLPVRIECAEPLASAVTFIARSAISDIDEMGIPECAQTSTRRDYFIVRVCKHQHAFGLVIRDAAQGSYCRNDLLNGFGSHPLNRCERNLPSVPEGERERNYRQVPPAVIFIEFEMTCSVPTLVPRPVSVL